MGRRVAGLGGRKFAKAIRGQASIAIAGGGGGGSGTISTFTSVNRDAGSKAGGATVIATCTGVTGTPTVTVGGVTATVTGTSSTTVTFTTPAYGGAAAAGGTLVDIVIAGVTLANGFEYHPIATTTYVANATMEDGTDGDWVPDGGAGADSTAFAYAGTHSRLFSCTTGLTAYALKTMSNNPALSEANGLYARWYTYVTEATVDNVIGGVGAGARQIKLHLWRTDVGVGQPGYLSIGFGTAYADGRNIVVQRDNGTIAIHNTGVDPGDTWLEHQVWITRKNATGRAKYWLNGKLEKDHTHVDMGSDTAGETSGGPRIGIGYAVCLSGSVGVYVDNAACLNGFIDP